MASHANYKIAIDTNVILSASIMVNVKQLNLQVKHKFYDQARQFFSLFFDPMNKKLGILPPTAKREAFSLLNKVAWGVLREKAVSNITQKRDLFNNAVSIINLCDQKMRILACQLIHATPSKNEVTKNIVKVNTMSSYIKYLWDTRYSTPYLREKLVQERAKPIAGLKTWTPEQKKEAMKAHREQIVLESKQLQRFMKCYPNSKDTNILAEVISMKDFYNNNGKQYKFHIASFDRGFFSPLENQNSIKSDIVTNEIKSRFDIVCDIPSIIFNIMGGSTQKSVP